MIDTKWGNRDNEHIQRHTAKWVNLMSTMNTKEIASSITILICFVLFLILLITGYIMMSIPMIIAAFILGFIGYAILEHEAQVTYKTEDQWYI